MSVHLRCPHKKGTASPRPRRSLRRRRWRPTRLARPAAPTTSRPPREAAPTALDSGRTPASQSQGDLAAWRFTTGGCVQLQPTARSATKWRAVLSHAVHRGGSARGCTSPPVGPPLRRTSAARLHPVKPSHVGGIAARRRRVHFFAAACRAGHRRRAAAHGPPRVPCGGHPGSKLAVGEEEILVGGGDGSRLRG